MSKTRLSSVLFIGVGVVLGLSALALSQDNPCDPQLKPPEANPYKYELREDRCEGIYVQEVSSTALNIVSFTAVYEAFDVEASASLTLAWDAPAGMEALERDAPVQLRAQGAKRKLYYRMDAVQPRGGGAYAWPTDVLRGLGLGKEDLGVVAWTNHYGQEVYLPLYVSQNNGSAASAYVLSILPDAELEEVWVSLNKESAENYLRNGEALGYGYYPAGRVFTVTLPLADLSGPGVYQLELAARLASGQPVTQQLRFYHGAAAGE